MNRHDNETPDCDESVLWLVTVLIALGMATIAVMWGLPK